MKKNYLRKLNYKKNLKIIEIMQTQQEIGIRINNSKLIHRYSFKIKIPLKKIKNKFNEKELS